MRIIHGIEATGIIVAFYGLLWGTFHTFALALFFATLAWLVGDCWRDAKEAGQ